MAILEQHSMSTVGSLEGVVSGVPEPLFRALSLMREARIARCGQVAHFSVAPPLDAYTWQDQMWTALEDIQKLLALPQPSGVAVGNVRKRGRGTDVDAEVPKRGRAECPVQDIDDASFPSTFSDPELPIGTIESLPDVVVDPDISTLPVYQYDLTV